MARRVAELVSHWQGSISSPGRRCSSAPRRPAQRLPRAAEGPPGAGERSRWAAGKLYSTGLGLGPNHITPTRPPTNPLGAVAACECAKAASPPPRLSPIFLELPLHRGRVGVLELEPVARAAGNVKRPQPLRDDAFEAHLARVAKDDVAGVLQVLVEPQASAARSQHTSTRATPGRRSRARNGRLCVRARRRPPGPPEYGSRRRRESHRSDRRWP
jgi:hypothetical protein